MANKQINTVFIVNGVDVPVKINANSYVDTGKKRALKLSNNLGRPFDEWEIHTPAGRSVSPREKATDESVFFLNLRVGVGG